MADAPDDPSFVEWLHGPHMEEVKSTPGVTKITRYEVIDGPGDRRQYVGIVETDDLDATIAWRSSPEGQRSQEEANRRGIRNRYGLICRPVYSSAER
jgi:hypothetical protein